jgi:nitrite reductase/ring-hydroxylating ferredoxin subunit
MYDPNTAADDAENEEPFVRAFSLAELPAGESRMEQVGDYDVAFFNVGGEIYALDDVCPHFGGSLHLGPLLDDGKIVACPLHGWRFNLSDGKMNPGKRSVSAFDVRIENGDVYVSREPRPAV